MEMKVYGVFQKCSGILNLNLVPAFQSKYDYTVLHSDKLKPLNKNETDVACSTPILSNVPRQRDKAKCCLLTVNNRKRWWGRKSCRSRQNGSFSWTFRTRFGCSI